MGLFADTRRGYMKNLYLVVESRQFGYALASG